MRSVIYLSPIKKGSHLDLDMGRGICLPCKRSPASWPPKLLRAPAYTSWERGLNGKHKWSDSGNTSKGKDMLI